jgi:uncharacterized protein YndB with AHSA1/START domain
LDTFKIKKELKVSASIERVFKALTSSEEIPKYFPLQSVESRREVGSEVLYKGEVNGTPFTDYGVIEKLEYPKIYSYRYWSDNHGTKRSDENFLTISYNLEEMSGFTVLNLTQSNIKSVELYELMNTQVWDYLLACLKEYLDTPT